MIWGIVTGRGPASPAKALPAASPLRHADAQQRAFPPQTYYQREESTHQTQQQSSEGLMVRTPSTPDAHHPAASNGGQPHGGSKALQQPLPQQPPLSSCNKPSPFVYDEFGNFSFGPLLGGGVEHPLAASGGDAGHGGMSPSLVGPTTPPPLPPMMSFDDGLPQV